MRNNNPHINGYLHRAIISHSWAFFFLSFLRGDCFLHNLTLKEKADHHQGLGLDNTSIWKEKRRPKESAGSVDRVTLNVCLCGAALRLGRGQQQAQAVCPPRHCAH